MPRIHAFNNFSLLDHVELMELSRQIPYEFSSMLSKFVPNRKIKGLDSISSEYVSDRRLWKRTSKSYFHSSVLNVDKSHLRVVLASLGPSTHN